MLKFQFWDSHQERPVRTSLFFAVIISCVHLTLGGFACLENPCFHGICIDYLEINRTHQCYCRNGYTGYSCEINWDECSPNPCLNGGKCTDGIASFNCSCPENLFTGALCQYDLTACEELFPCQNNGTCTIDTTFGNETLSCICPPGFNGPQCEFDVSMCNSTENICMNGGKCVDGVGDTFHCQCEPGWEGVFCQTMVDNCASLKPCQNGGICVNKLNDFGCACPFGYAGKSCEKKLRICQVNPCQNDAFCLHEHEDESKFTCYCVPDYHGDLCQWKYDDCSPPPKCNNGGTCIDGVGGFFCSCPPDLFGPTCQCTQDNMTDPICQVNQTIITSYPSQIFPPSTFLHPDFTIPSASFEITSLPTTSLTFMTSVIDLTTPVSTLPSTEGFSIEYETSLPTDISISTTLLLSPSFTSALEPSESFATMLPYSTPAIELVTTTTATSVYDQHHNLSSLASPTDDLSISMLPPSATISEPVIVTSIPSSQTSKIEFSVTPTTEKDQSDPVSVSWEYSTVELQPSMTTEPSLSTVAPDFSISMSTLEPSINISSSTLSPSFYVSTSTPMLPSEELTTTASTSQEITPTANISASLTSAIFEPDLSSIPHIFASDWSLDTTVRIQPSGTELFLPTSIITEFSTAGPESSLLISSLLSPTASMQITTPEPTVSIFPSPPPTSPSTTNASVTDLCQNLCLNDGQCIADSIEPRCICSFKYFGSRCENPRRKLESISFSGDSFLEYKAPNNSINRISVRTTFATNVPDSILLYTANKSGRLYGLVFTQGGHITLHFSCGTQSMHFVETRTRVDNGKNFTMEFQLEMVVHGLQASEIHCVGQISLNHSYIMRGEQIVGTNELHEDPIQFIYLGGVDAENIKKSDDIIRIMPGLRGCLYALSINGEEKDLFDDAINGKEITECAAFECVSNPCFGSSKCVPWNKQPFWQCLCPPGFRGPRCQVRVCDSNPCRNGATCTFPSDDANSIGPTTVLNGTANISTLLGSDSICLCPLGFSGLQCQTTINITKPSFKPVLGFDYASYIAYEPIPRFADWVQLKLHFVTRNISQVALILYSGYSNNLGESSSLSNPDQIHALSDAIKEGPGSQQLELESLADTNEISGQRVSDFFAITFVQGYIALTWNLGSGIHRIITPSRIDKRLNVHTLFAGRAGRQAWLKVDGMRNITGKSPGPFHRLNVNSELFLGGYEKFRFEGMPYDLALHKGFEGCIFDFGFRVKNRLYLPKPLRGRSVKNCYEEDC